MNNDYGLVLYGNGNIYNVLYRGEIVTAILRRKFLYKTENMHHPIAVGDKVYLLEQKENSYMINEILERKNKISRPANFHFRKEQIIAANIDYMFLVVSYTSPQLNTGFIDRILAYSEMENIKTVLVINKSDLEISEEENKIVETYRNLSYEIIETSVKSLKNINIIKEKCSSGISVFIGPSGVGKSSLLNSIDKTIMQKNLDMIII